MAEDTQDVRQQAEIEDMVRAEWNGNKYYVPRSFTVRRKRHRAWTWALLAGLILAYVVAIRFVIPWIITGRLG